MHSITTRFAFGAVLLLGCLLTSGPAEAKYNIHLMHSPISVGGDAQLAATVGVNCTDARPDGKGAGKPDLIGQIRATLGIPYGVYTSGGTAACSPVASLVTQALGGAGIRAVGLGASHIVEVKLLRLWGDGYGSRYEMAVEVHLSLRAAAGGPVLFETILEAAEGVTVMGKGLDTGYTRTLDALGSTLVQAFRSPAFQDPLRGAAPAAAAQPAAAQPAAAAAGAQQELPPSSWTDALDKTVVVERTDGLEVHGTFTGYDENTVVIVKADGRIVSVDRSQVARILGTP